MNPLMYLLGQQSGTAAVDPTNIVALMGGNSETAPVTGGSAPNSEAITNVQDDVAKGEQASQRRGMFGMKGTLRDVLGVLGDAFLIQSGNAPMYAPRRRQEQISDAMAGFTENPVAAAERTAQLDYGLGRQLYEDYENNLVKKAQAESAAAARQSLIDDRNAKQLDRGVLQAQSLVAQDGAYAPDGSLTPEATQVLNLIARQNNTTPEALLGNLQGGAARLFAGSRTTPYQQQRLEDADQTLALNKQKLEVAIRGVKDRERRTQIAEQILGLRRDDQRFDQMLDLFGMSLDFTEATSKEKKGRRQVPGASPAIPKPSVSNW